MVVREGAEENYHSHLWGKELESNAVDLVRPILFFNKEPFRLSIVSGEQSLSLSISLSQLLARAVKNLAVFLSPPAETRSYKQS